MKRLVLVLLAVLLLCGCSRDLADYTLNAVPTTLPTEETKDPTDETREFREYATYPVERPSDRVIGNAFYYTDSRYVYYYDVDLRRRVVLCSQPNCTHSDDGCTAYLGGGERNCYQVVGDTVYALVQNDVTVQLIAKNLVTGQRWLIWDLTPEKDETHIQYAWMSMDGNSAFVTYEQYDSLFEDGVLKETNRQYHAYDVDLTTGERKPLLDEKILSFSYPSFSHCTVTIATEKYLLLRVPGYGYYSVNRETGMRTRICGNHEEARLTDIAVYREKSMSFVDGNTVCVYDGRTGNVTRYFQQENIGFQNLLDGRIIYNVRTGEGMEYDFFWYDLTTGEKQQFQKGIKGMVFSVLWETEDYFVGLYEGTDHFLSKQDFYNENYDAAF